MQGSSMDNMDNESILIIGPMGVGKSSAAKALSSILSIEYINVDELRWEYFYGQTDFNKQFVDQLFNEKKFIEAFAYMKPFEARYAVDILAKYDAGVFDFGAGYSVYQNNELFEKVRTAFAKFKHVILLRYSNDAAESLEALRGRHPDVPEDFYYVFNKEFIESRCNEVLSTCIIDTKNKTVQEVVDLILQKYKADTSY